MRRRHWHLGFGGVNVAPAALLTDLWHLGTGTASIGTTFSQTAGFEVKGGIAISNARGSAGSDNLSTPYSVGFFAGTADRRCSTSFSLAASDPSQFVAASLADALIEIILGTSGSTGRIDVDNISATVLRLIADEATSGNSSIIINSFGGGVTLGATGSIVEPGATGSQALGLPWDADIIFFKTSQLASSPPQFDTAKDFAMMYAWAHGSGTDQQAVMFAGSDDAAGTTQSICYCRRGECIALFNVGATAIDALASLTSLTGGGTVNWASRTAAGRIIHWLALKGGTWKTLFTTTPGTTSTNWSLTGAGFTPTWAHAMTCRRAVESTSGTPQNEGHFGMGFAKSASLRGAVHIGLDDATSAVVNDRSYSNSTLLAPMAIGSGITGPVDLLSMDADGVTLRQTGAGTAYFFPILLAK